VAAGGPDGDPGPRPVVTEAVSACQVMSDLPGRLRVRLSSGASGPELERRLNNEPGVTGCLWTPRTRSLLVTYRPDEATRTALIAAVAPSTGPMARPAPPKPRRERRERSVLASVVTEAAAQFDARVANVTGGLLDLRTGVALALALWAVREVLRGNARPLAWTSAIWYAHGLFRDYALPPDQDGA
jgi:hypothetical protein